jgi:Na+(H+)/acetate symporter ActP
MESVHVAGRVLTVVAPAFALAAACCLNLPLDFNWDEVPIAPVRT